MNLKNIFVSLILSCVLYIALFFFVFHKPLTIGIIGEYFDKKLSYLQTENNNKIIILAGSNGRFSHRCEVIERIVNKTCVNMSISADISIEYMLNKLKPYLRANDLIYLPIEYSFFYKSENEPKYGAEAPFIASYDHGHLIDLEAQEIINIAFYFDLKYLFSCIGEMALVKAGMQRRFSINTMTKQGDEKFHNVLNSAPYRKFVNNVNWEPPVINDKEYFEFKKSIIQAFLSWAIETDIKVVGGLPTTFNDIEINDNYINILRKIYINGGQNFLVLSNKSQYPRSYFYDSKYHLSEEYQIKHSKKIAKNLIKYF